MKHLDILPILFSDLGRDPSVEFRDPDSNSQGTRQVAKTESGLWLALRSSEGMHTLTAHRTEKGARYVTETAGKLPEPAFLKVRACEACVGELQDADGTVLTVEVVRGENYSLELDAHSPEFQLTLDCFTLVARLRGGIEVSPKNEPSP